MSNELAMCLTNIPAAVRISNKGMGVESDVSLVGITPSQRIHGQWLHGLFYFPMSNREGQATMYVGHPQDFAPIIEEPQTA